MYYCTYIVYTFEFIYYVKLQRGLDKLISMLSFLVYAIYLVGIALTGLTLPHVSACLKPEPGWQRSYILVCLCWVKMRGDCLLWWICWPSLFEISFHNCTVATCTVDLLNNINILYHFSSNNYITFVYHWNVTIWLVMKWSHDYKRDVSHPNETQIRTCTCLHDDVRCKQSMA